MCLTRTITFEQYYLTHLHSNFDNLSVGKYITVIFTLRIAPQHSGLDLLHVYVVVA